MNSQPTGSLPPNFPNLVMLMPAVFQAHGVHLHRIDPAIVNLSHDIFSTIGVLPVPRIDDGGLGSPGEGTEETPDIDKVGSPDDKGEGRRYQPLIPKKEGEGDVRDIRDIPAKMEKEFKEIVLKVAEKLLPEQDEIPKAAVVEKVAESTETVSATTIKELVSNLKETPSSGLTTPAANQKNELSQISQGNLTIVSGADSSATKGAEAVPAQDAAGALINGAAFEKSQVNNLDPVVITTPPHYETGGNNLAIANTSLIPLQTTLTQEGVQSIAQSNPENLRVAADDKSVKKGFEQTITPPTPASSDVQGMTVQLAAPLGLLPVLPAHVVNLAEGLKGRKEDLSIGGVVHRSLQHERQALASSSDSTPILIPSDRPNLHRIPDGRELAYIAQMADLGMYKGKRVEDSTFRLSDGLKLDPGYRFGDLLVISFFATMCGAASITQIGAFVEDHEEWILSNFDMRRGIPSPLIFMWLFSRITPYYFTKIVLQHIDCITNRRQGRRSPFNSMRIWDTNQGVIFGQSKTETKAPSQGQFLRIFDWSEATLILEPAEDPLEVQRSVNARLLLSVSADQKELLVGRESPITTKNQEWNDGLDSLCNLELSLYPNWTVGVYTKIQEGILRVNRNFVSNLPIDFAAWNTIFYERSDIEEQTVWVGEGRFLTLGEVTVSHAIDNFDLLRQVSYKRLLESKTLEGSIEQKRQKLWEDPDELLILIHY